jgi:hypothetical protein
LLKTHLIGLENSIKAEELVRKAQILFKAVGQIQITLNPLALSIIIKENEGILGLKEDFKGITEIEKKLDWIGKPKWLMGYRQSIRGTQEIIPKNDSLKPLKARIRPP